MQGTRNYISKMLQTNTNEDDISEDQGCRKSKSLVTPSKISLITNVRGAMLRNSVQNSSFLTTGRIQTTGNIEGPVTFRGTLFLFSLKGLSAFASLSPNEHVIDRNAPPSVSLVY